MRAGDKIEDRYELRESLGAGGMAEVWLAHDLRLDRPVALKFLSSALTADPENLVRFFSEAQSIARIQHPNVVTVLDFGEAGDCPYLALEHVSGGPLTDITGRPLLPERALEIVAEAAAGAGAAHVLGIVHRDIKPGNILLDETGRAKLCDFGIASSMRAAERMTASGVAIGSPHYISPEQASGGEVTPASDVYALGVVLYELLTGVRPFEGANMTAVVIAHVEREPEPPSARVAGLSPALDAVVLSCLAKDPAARYADGGALRDALEPLNELGADATSPAPAKQRSARGRRTRIALGVAALAALAGLVAFRGVAFDDRGGAEAHAGEDRSGPGSESDRRRVTRPEQTDSGDAGTPSPAAAVPVPAASPRPDDREEDESEREEEPEPEPTPSESPEPEPTPTPDGEVTPTPVPSDTGAPSTS